jgi:UDP-N-acetylmuramate dehydrogenase
MVTAIVKSNRSIHQKEAYKKLLEAFGNRLKQNVILAPYTTLGIGGRADLFYPATRLKDLISIIRIAQEGRVRFFILGGGSNVLVSDSGFRGLVILNQCRNMMVNQNVITCQSGSLLDDLVNRACSCSLAGLEFAAKIPGTVGGAIRGNAGAFGKSVGDILTRAVLLTGKGEIREVEKSYFRFAYRESHLKLSGDVLLSATFGLQKSNQDVIEKTIKENIREREEKLPWGEKSAGCFFKNIVQEEEKISAGLLLDQVGAKGMQVRDAKVSAKHANILINAKNAQAEDVKKLAQRLKKKVKEKFNIDLEEEVVYIK